MAELAPTPTTRDLQNILTNYQTGTPYESDTETPEVNVSQPQVPNAAPMAQIGLPIGVADGEVPSEEKEEPAPSFSQWLGSPSISQQELGTNYSDAAALAGFGTSKYDTDYYQGQDLEQNRALEQSGFAKIMTGLGKGVVTAGATAVNTTLGTVVGLGSALFETGKVLSGNGNIMDIVDAGTNNFISQQMINLQNWSEEFMPNYRTQEERSEKYQREWYKHMGTANFIGDSILKNFGFTVGAMGGARVWTKLIGAAMSSKLMNDVMRGVAVASNGDSAATAELTRAMQALQRGNIVRVDAEKLAANIKNVGKRLNSASARLQLYGAALGAVGEGTTEGLMAKNEFLTDYGNRMQRQWASEYQGLESELLHSGNKFYVKDQAVQFEDGTLRDVPMLTEAGKAELQRRQQEVTRKYEDMGKYAAEQGERLASTTMLLNIPILTTSNMIQFGRMLAGGWKNQRSLARATGKLGSVKTKGSVAGKTILNSLKVAASEGTEEMLQGAVSSGTKQVADYRLSAFNDAGYDDEAVHSVRSWFENMSRGSKDYLADKKNWQEGFIGALTGLLGIPGRRWGGGVIGSYQEAKQEMNAEKLAADELNRLVNSDGFQNRWRGYIRHLKYDNDMSKAAVADDEYAYHTASDNQLINDVITFAQAGRLDDLRSQVSDYREVADRDVEDIRSILQSSDDPQMKSWAQNATDKEITEAVQQKADTILRAIDEYKDIYDALASRAPADATPKFLSELVFTAQQIKAMDRRFLSVLDKTLKGDDTTPGVDAVLETLAAVKTGKDITDAETRRTFELMRDTYERAFGNFLVPSEISPAMQELIIKSLDELESLTEGIDGLNKNVKDLRKMSEARRELYGKLETLQAPGGVQSFEDEATTQEQVDQAAEEVAIQQETQDLTSLNAVKDAYFAKRTEAERNDYINTLRTASNSNPNIKSFLELKQFYDNFKSFVTNKPIAYSDITVTPPMVVSAINDALMLASTKDEFVNLPDKVFKTKAEFDAANQTPFGVPSPTAYNSVKKMLRDWMREYLQLDSDTATRHNRPDPNPAPVTPLEEQITPTDRDASQPGSALPLPVKQEERTNDVQATESKEEERSEKTPEQQLAFNTVLKMLDNAGIPVEEVSDETLRQMANAAGAQLMAFGEAYDYEAFPRGRVEPGLADKEVQIVEANEKHGFKNLDEARSWARENIVRTYNNKESGNKGEVRISNLAVGKFLSKSAVDKSDSLNVHFAALKVLPAVLKASVDVETHPDFRKNDNGVHSVEMGFNPDVLIHRCYGAIDIAGDIYRVKITLKENVKTRETTGTHSYEAIKIELLDGQSGSVAMTLPRNSDNSISAAKLLKDVKMSYDSSKKVLDESRKNTPESSDGASLLRVGDTIYGIAKDGKIYLNETAFNPSAPIHEYTHLWDNACKAKNPELWKRGVELMKRTSLWHEVATDPNYAGLDEDGIASEVHSRLVGSEGMLRLEKLGKKALEENDGKVDDATGSRLIDSLREWLQDFWYWLYETFVPWSKYDSSLIKLEGFINLPLSSLVKGESVSTEFGEMKPAEKPTEEQLADETAAAGASYKPSPLEERASSYEDEDELDSAGIPYLRSGMPEIDSEQAAIARSGMKTGNGDNLRRANLSDFPVLHPEYATIWNALAVRGAFDNMAEVKVGDEIEFVIDRTFPKYNGEYQILMTTVKNGERKVLSVLPRNNRRSKYLNMDSLREAIDNEYTEFLKTHSANELFVFSKTSKVWSKLPGYIDYGFEKDNLSEQPIKTTNSYSKTAPIVFINRKGEPVVVRGNDITAGDKMGYTFQDPEYNKDIKRRIGNLYYLVKMNDESYIPVRLGVEHLAEDELDKADTSAIRQSAVDSIARLADIVKDTTNLNLEEQNKKLHAELATLIKSLSLYGVFFELGEYDNVGVALRVNNDEISKLIRPEQISSTKQLVKFLAQFHLPYQIRQPKDPKSDRDFLDKIINFDEMIDDGLITTNATKLRMKGSDFRCFAWDDKTKTFRPATNAQVALNDSLEREAKVEALETAPKVSETAPVPESVEDFTFNDSDDANLAFDVESSNEQQASIEEKPLESENILANGNNGSSSDINERISKYTAYSFTQLPQNIQKALQAKGYTEEAYDKLAQVMRERALTCLF